MKILIIGILLSIISLYGCNDDTKKSQFGFKYFSNENSFTEFLLLERGDSEFDTLSTIYLNFDTDSISINGGKYLDYHLQKLPVDQSMIKWDISYYLGSRPNNIVLNKKLKKKDLIKVGSCSSRKKIGNGQEITFTNFKPKSIEDAFFSKNKLQYIHHWLVKGKKIKNSDRLILIQISRTSNSHSANVLTVN